MRQNRGILIIGLSVILIILLVGFLMKGTNEGIGTAIGVFNRESTKLSEENQYDIELDDVGNINIGVTVDDIIIEETNDKDIRIIEKSNYKLEDSEKLQINQDGNVLNIVRYDKNTLSKRNNINRKLEIYIPKDYTGSLMVDNTVGDIKIRSELKLDRLDIKQNVGNLKLDSHIVCNAFDFKNTTGDMDIESIKGNGSIEGKVGNIECYLDEITGDISIQNTTGDIDISINQDSSFILDSKYSIGELETNIKLSNASTSKKHFGGNYGDNPENIIKIEANIGDIDISVK